jgi:O-antigen/teichoic acid export membrane protein
VCAGLLNYLFGLAMTALLRPSQYSVFASANAIVLVMGTVANAAVPWLLAKQIASRRAGETDQGEVRAALVLNLFEGSVAGLIAMLCVLSFAGLVVAIWVGVATISFFVASTGMGWAQGHERFGLLAALVVTEVMVRIVCAGVLVSLGSGPAGAYIGAVVGAGLICVAMLPLMWNDLRSPRVGLHTGLWRTAFGTAAVQSAITALSVADVFFVSLRFHAGSSTATYQVAATLGRTPLFVALAFSTEAFPALARDPGHPGQISHGLERILGVLAPLTVIVMTLPEFLIHLLPAGYRNAGHFLPVVALIGAAYSLVLVQSTPLRAAGRTRPCLLTLVTGLIGSVALMAVASHFGIIGLAIGAAAGGWCTVIAMAVVTEREWPGAARPRVRFLGIWIGVGAILFLARGTPALWTPVAAIAAVAVVRGALQPSLRA